MNTTAAVATTTPAPKAKKTIEVTDANFEDTTLKSPVPVLVDFWAAWCSPCRTMDPHVDALAAAYDGKVRFGKCDADANQEILAKLDVRSLPTFLVFKDGRVVGQIVGAVPRSRLEDMVRKSLT